MADADRDSDLGDDSPVMAPVHRIMSEDLRFTKSARSGESTEQSGDSSDEGLGTLDGREHLPPPPRHHPSAHPLHAHRDNKIRDDFESLKSSLHPHLSSLASLAQGAPLNSSPLTSGASAPFSLPMGFPFQAPASFLPPPAPPAPPPAQPGCSSSSSSSEGSSSWSFEEQYKQVRQLYEISDEPQRKEFLDDLFSFMQKRGTPINRLPIMAKSVLDLYELYNLVIARGGLVEVINKKLWQEIIKGLRLPSSITSAAFTLRTQYMKYLYEYECEKKNLSTRSELDAAIEGNKREGRRASGQYDAQAALNMPGLQRAVPVSLHQLTQHMQPLSLSLGGGGVGAGGPRLPPLPPHAAAQLSHHELEYRVREYMKLIQQQQRDFRRNGSESPPGVLSPREAALNALDVSRLTLWSLYNNNNNNTQPHVDMEPQRSHPFCSEALNLSESPAGVKREAPSPAPPAKRRTPRPSPPPHVSPPRAVTPPAHQLNGGHGANFKITTRGDASTGDQQLVVSIELNGVTYEGVLFPSAQTGPRTTPGPHRPLVS